jgi:ribosomal protein S18 acetylase RimI-like enzyme
MVRRADLIVTARAEGRVIGVARALTDFAYCCYVSELAVDQAFQRQGIGQRLLREIQARVSDRVSVLLVAAPAAETYYPRIGMKHVPSCWSFPRAR